MAHVLAHVVSENPLTDPSPIRYLLASTYVKRNNTSSN